MSDDEIRHREKMAKRKAAQDAEVAGKTIEKGLLIVHTGPGKGKTTAALGLTLRALGRGWRVGIVQFIKGAWDTGERHALKAFGEQVDRAANRLTMGVITAALVVGSSIVMNSAGGGVSSRWLLALGVLGFVGAGLIGLWILLSIWRSGRR